MLSDRTTKIYKLRCKKLKNTFVFFILLLLLLQWESTRNKIYQEETSTDQKK